MTRTPKNGRGLACSVAIHALVLTLIAVAPDMAPVPPAMQPPMTVTVIRLGESGMARSGRPGESSAPAEDRPASKPKAVRAQPLHPAFRQPTAAPADFDSRLRAASAAFPRSIHGNETGDSNKYGRQGAYAAKDIIRAQIQRRWIFDVAKLGSSRWAVSIHVVLDADGTVTSATIIEDPRHQTDPAYLELARSARNAALAASPIVLPPGTPAEARDTVLDFDPLVAGR